MGKPNATQIKFFNANEGGPASAGIAILRAQKSPKLTYKLISQSPVVPLEPYFGKTAQFPLATTLPVKKGDVVALTVPSWAPALALGFGKGTSWRASRGKGQCTTTGTQTAHVTVGADRAVLLPLPDRPPHLQRDADLNALRARRAQSGRDSSRPGRAGDRQAQSAARTLPDDGFF